MSSSGQNQRSWSVFALLGLLLAAVECGGCAAPPEDVPKGSSDALDGRDGDQPIALAELDELTRAFADRYVGLLSSTCDALKKDNPDLVQRREAQELLVNCATNVYDIASNADAVTRVLDLVIVTTLVSQVWIDDDRAGEVFGDRAEVLVRALRHGRVEAWALAGQVLTPDQLDLLDYMIWDWRRRNPDMIRVPFVRFSNFAIGRGKSANAEVLAAGGFFAKVGQAGQAVDEARMLTERMFYQFKRQPTLLRWEAEALKDELLATPDLATYLADFHRLTEQAEQLPRNVAAERAAILAALDERLANASGALTDANQLVTSVGKTSDSLNEMLKTAAVVFVTSSTQPSRPFDIREYTQGVKELTVAVGNMNDMIESSDRLLGSSHWARRIQEINQSADGRMKVAAEQSQMIIDHLFWRAVVAVGVLFAMLVLYRVISLLLTRRFRAAAEGAGARTDRPMQGNGHEVLLAPDLPGKGTSE